ncbi:uncharacterized protein LOC131952956 [Physella acuta]|uniref:uncharacterized protein LOC131952956 n=1 Tax=Physella acuta TaxID=109671 RepID=UPI0027DE9954|nr:uncharacterized protein LOC131952956 [Physella acuta]
MDVDFDFNLRNRTLKTFFEDLIDAFTDNFLSRDFLHDYMLDLDFFINVIFIQIICVLGVTGNIFNIIVLTKHGFHDTTNIILTSLSFSDLLFSITTSMSCVHNAIKIYDPYLAMKVYVFYAKHLAFANTISNVSGLVHVAVIAVERVFAVCLLIVLKLWITSKTMHQNTSRLVSRQVRDLKAVKMLLIVCVTYVTLLGPPMCMDLYMQTAEIDLSTETAMLIVERFLYQINASINFIIYVTASSKFAKTYKGIFSCKRKMKAFQRLKAVENH